MELLNILIRLKIFRTIIRMSPKLSDCIPFLGLAILMEIQYKIYPITDASLRYLLKIIVMPIRQGTIEEPIG